MTRSHEGTRSAGGHVTYFEGLVHDVLPPHIIEGVENMPIEQLSRGNGLIKRIRDNVRRWWKGFHDR